MNIRYLFSALFSACIVLAGCSDDILEDKVVWQEGDGIVFGARAGIALDQKSSRTEYTGETFRVGDLNYEKIHWVLNDKVSIYSPQANVVGGGFYADYKIDTRIESTNVDYATLLPVDPANVLQWGASLEHEFFGCYPTQASTTSADGKQSGIVLTKNNQNTLHLVGRVPHNQIPTRIVETVENGITIYTAKPHMSSAHMVAYGVGNRTDETINLTFKTICTAVEIELTGRADQEVVLTHALIGSPTQNVVGKYECDLLASKDQLPLCNNVITAEAKNQVLIPLMDKETGLGVKLGKNQKLRFTVFLLPTVNFNDLELTLATPNGRKSHKLVGAGNSEISIQMHKKNFIRNIKLPKGFNSADWMSRLDNQVKIDQLSIPGSGNSFSYNYPDGKADTKYFKTQNKNIEGQWNMGIRCFEITSDRRYDLGAYVLSLGNREILGHGAVGTVGEAVDSIAQQVKKHPTEFAVVIMNYQPEKYRNAAVYIEQCEKFINTEVSVPVKTYKPNMTLGEARGGILFVLRPTSNGEDPELGLTQDNKPYIIVDGWGSLQDKWVNRGYVGVTSNSGKKDFTHSYEQYMLKELPSNEPVPVMADFALPKKDSTKINYLYKTNAGVNIWAQEWNRVVENDRVTYLASRGLVNIYNLYGAWKASYKEKFFDARKTFEYAVEKKYPNTLYINCLTGYFMDFTDVNNPDFVMPNHAMPNYIIDRNGGKYGNVETFAKRINQEFFTYMWKKWNERITGPMGIVMMNKVGAGTPEMDPENFYMPNIVISNNFSFPLETVKQ